jgi:lipopolysaccharide transport system permease protein
LPVSETAHTQLAVNRAPRGWLPELGLRELLRFRELVLILAVRDVQVRYKQTLLGVAWAVVQPLLGVAVFTVVFGRIAGLSSEGVAFPVFAYVGLTAWNYISRATDAAAQSLLVSRELVTKVYFPRLLAPLAALGPSLIELGIALVLGIGFFIAYGTPLEPQVVLLPLTIVAAALVAASVGIWLCALNVEYRDVAVILPVGLQLWFYASPVVWSPTIFDGVERWLIALNPAVGVIDLFRWMLIGLPAPPPADLAGVVSTALLLITGTIHFLRAETRFADVI